MKKQFLSLIVALFVTSTFVLANNGQPTVETPPSTDISEFIAPENLGMIAIAGIAVEQGDNNILCKTLDDSNKVCARILRKGERESIIYLNDRNGFVAEKMQVKSYSLRQVMKGSTQFYIIDYIPFESDTQTSTTFQTLSIQ